MLLQSNAYYEEEHFSDEEWDQAAIEGTEFAGCIFKRCSLKEGSLAACRFEDCTFEDCDLSLVDLTKSSFKGTRFVKSKLIGIDWGKASWGNKQLQTLLKVIEFEDCVLNFSTFIGLDLPGLRMEKCIAHEVDFSESNLSQGDFRKTDFAKAIFRNTYLSEANFLGAKDYLIDPATNRIKGAKFSLPAAMSLLYSLDIDLRSEEEAGS